MRLLDRVRSRLAGWLGVRADSFISVQQVQDANAGIGGRVKPLDANVVMAPVQWIMRTFTQADVVVQRFRTGLWRTVEGHPVTDLLEEPNPFYDGDALLKGLLLSYHLDGNGCLLKARGDLRRIEQLWYVPHWLIEPRWPEDGSSFLSHFEYRPPGLPARRIHPEDVVHVRFGIDPRNTRQGLSPIKAALREVMTDEEAATFTAFILKNMGIPGLLISPKDASVMPSQEDVEEMKQYVKAGFTGERRGTSLVVGAPTNVEQFGFDPNRLMLANLRDISEERVCAMLGLPAAVVGFGAGLQQTKVGATMRELVRLARVNCIEPTQKTIGKQLSRSLLKEFEIRPKSARIRFDNSGVGLFAEDLAEAADRAVKLKQARIIGLEQAQRIAGVEPEEIDEPEPAIVPPVPPENRIAGVPAQNGRT